ncbi:MAG TPA: alpha/beta hydrolase [bacterium]|nr:alpha/beta hydrolase [bacterium]
MIFLAHANGFPPETYAPVLEPLRQHFHVIAFRARPFWEDTPATWLKRWSQMADDLLEGLVELGDRPVVGLGHSLGGVLMLYAAVRCPELFSRLVLIDPTMLAPKLLWEVRFLRLFGLEARPQLVKGAFRRRTHWAGKEEAYRYFRERPLFKAWPDGTVRAYSEHMTGPAPQGGMRLIYPPEWEARIYQTIPTDVWAFAARIPCPTLVIRGEDSTTFTGDSEKTFRKVLPSAQFRVIPGAGHLVAQEKPLEVGTAILDFLME